SAQYGLPKPLLSGQDSNATARELLRRTSPPSLFTKVASNILDVLAAMNERRAVGLDTGDRSDLSTPLVRVNASGEIQVYVILSEFRPEYVGQLTALGLREELTAGSIVQGWVQADAIGSIAALEFVRQIREPGYALHNQSGAVDTLGNNVLRA